MKINFLRNCASKNEYHYFLKICPQQFETFECIIIKQIYLTEEDYFSLINNLRLNNSIFSDLRFESIIEDNIAKVIKVINKNSQECFYSILNGHHYSKYSSF